MSQALRSATTEKVKQIALTFPTDDYKEFLELGLLILGGTPEWKKGWSHSIQRPGADSHARWMFKAIYTLKLILLQHQFPDISWHKKKLEKMTFFILFAYMESWFASSFLFSAAQNDLLLHQRLLKFSKFHNKLSQVGLLVLQCHTWHLTEELVPLSFFSNNVSIEVQNILAQKISTLPASDHSIQKPSLPVITAKSSLPDYIGPRSTVLFSILGISHSYPAEPDWRQNLSYEQVKTAVTKLTPVNDSCERALALATKFNGSITCCVKNRVGRGLRHMKTKINKLPFYGLF